MKKYTRIPLEVQADQYFPYKAIEVDGFRNVTEEMLDEKTMEKTMVVNRAEIIQGEHRVHISPGDWVVVLPGDIVTIRKNNQFKTDFIEVLGGPE